MKKLIFVSVIAALIAVATFSGGCGNSRVTKGEVASVQAPVDDPILGNALNEVEDYILKFGLEKSEYKLVDATLIDREKDQRCHFEFVRISDGKPFIVDADGSTDDWCIGGNITEAIGLY